MLLAQERSDIVRFGRKLLSSRLTTGSGGNLSICNRQEGLLAISPSGLDYLDLTPEDVVVLDMSGHKVDGRWKPSSELDFHLSLYQARADVCGVVHTHSVHATTMACLRWELPAVHYLVGFAGKKVAVAPYATFGTPELAANVTASIGTDNAVLLANHGLVAVGSNLQAAFNVAEEIELVAQIYLQTKAVGQPVILDEGEMDRVLVKFRSYGKQDVDPEGLGS